MSKYLNFMVMNILKIIIYLKNNGKSLMLLEVVVLKNLDIISVHARNVVKNILVLILVGIDTVQCVRIMHVKNGFKKNPVIY